MATTAMANLLQGCNSLGAVNSELRKTPSQKTPQVVEAERLSGTPIFLSCLYCQRGAAASPSGETNTFSQYSGGGESTVKSYPQRLFLFVLSCTQHRYYTGLTPSGRRSCRKAYGFMDSQKHRTRRSPRAAAAPSQHVWVSIGFSQGLPRNTGSIPSEPRLRNTGPSP